MKVIGFVAATSLAALLTAAPALAEEGQTVWRVFIGDHAAPKITAFDLSAPETRWNFDIAGQGKLFSVAGGSTVAAVQSDADRVDFVHSGISLVSHGDHSDISVEDPSLQTGSALHGPRPFHLVDHDGQVVINFDKGGYASILSGIAEGKPQVTEFPQTAPHHGFVTPFGTAMLGTVPSPVEGDPAPPRLGLQAYDTKGQPMGDVATCTAIHGEAFSGAYLVAGCKEGVLSVQETAEGPAFRMLPYPAELPAATTGTILGSPAMQIFLGNYGADGVVVIDPAEEPHFRYVKLPFRRIDFAMDPARPQFAYVLTEDGSLHRLNLLDATIEQSVKATQPYSMDGHWNDPRPRIAVAGDQVLVTDPLNSALRVVPAPTLDGVTAIPVDGQPYNLTVVGGSGMHH